MEGCEIAMKEFALSPEAMVMIAGSSKGTQPKYYEKGYWYKANINGYEGKAEYLANLVLEHSNVEDYVQYEECKINGKSGCRSENFLGEGETFLSFERLYEAHTGRSLANDIMAIRDLDDRIRYVCDFIENTVGVDCKEYLSKTLCLDALLLNSDRHFNNLGIVANLITGENRCAPIFDNGDALLSSFTKFPPDLTIEENAENVVGRPFSTNLYSQAKACGITLEIDYEGLEKELEDEPDCRALQVLKRQIELYRNVFPEMSLEKEEINPMQGVFDLLNDPEYVLSPGKDDELEQERNSC